MARVTEVLASGPVNIRAIASEGDSERPFFRIVTNDIATTEKALRKAGLEYKLSDILSIELLDRPGELAKVAKRLARAGINVESIYILSTRSGKTELALNVSDMNKALEVLKIT